MKLFLSCALALCGFVSCAPVHAATDLLRYNLTIDATACGNTEDVTGADHYYIAGVFTAVLPDGSARSYSAVTYPFAINDNEWIGYQAVLLDDMLPRGSRIYGQMRFYDEDFAKDWNAVAGKFNSAADAGVKAAAASGNPTAAAVAGAAYAAFKVFDAVSSADKDDLLGTVGVSIGDNTLSPGGVAKIVIKDGAMNYDYNHPARAIIKAQADQAFANKSLVTYYSGDTRFSKSDWTGWSSWAYTQSWFSFIEDPNLNSTSGQPIAQPNSGAWLNNMIEAKKAADKKRFLELAKYRKPFKVATTDKGKQPFIYQGNFTKKTTGPKPGTTVQGGGGVGGNLGNKVPGGLGNKIPGGLGNKIPDGALGGGINTGGDGTGMGGISTGTGIGGAQTLPGNGGTASNLPGQVPDGVTIPGAGGDETAGGETGTETPAGGETGGVGGGETAPAQLGAATTTPKVGKVGQTMAVQLDGKESQDFNLDLPAGQFFVYCDVQGIEGGVNSSLYLLKRNGAQMPQYGGHLLYWNSGHRTSRNGKPFSFAKPTSVRFRFVNEATNIANLWLTVVPATPAKFLPFGFGSKIKTAKIGANSGTGGPIESGEWEYLRATIPAGKWSVSLGIKSENSCTVDLETFDARGVPATGANDISIYGVGKDERKEQIVTFAKPTTLIFRVTSGAGWAAANYDVTIEPATE